MTAGKSPADRARLALVTVFGTGGEIGVATAPGRVNLIGEHTDYNEGFAMPMAIDRHVAVAFRSRADRLLRVHTTARGQTREIDLDRLGAYRHDDWASYVAGTAWALGEAGHRLVGADLAIDSDLLAGSGLSSSAALEVAVARALISAAGVEWDATEMATICRRAENDFVGVPCGVMDQMAAAASVAGRAMLLDCRSLETRSVAIPAHASVVVMDTGVRRAVDSDWYRVRVAACGRAVGAARAARPDVVSLRDVDGVLLASIASKLDGEALACATHVIAENERVLAFVDALGRDDLRAAGQLLDACHASLRDLYRVSCRELDVVVDAARAHPGCYGARMTGAGFGGCAIAFVDERRADDFISATRERVQRLLPSVGAFFRVAPSGGAALIAT